MTGVAHHNTELVWSYFQLLSDARIDEALELLDDSGSFWTLRTCTTTPIRDYKAYIRSAMSTITMTFVLHNAIEDGDQVVLETSSHGTLSNGFDYTNDYCFVIRVRGDKIVDIREYFDTKRAQELADQRT